MAVIVTRASKGSELTHAEVDANFTQLNLGLTTNTAITSGTMSGVTLSSNAFSGTGNYVANNAFLGAKVSSGTTIGMLGINSSNVAYVGPKDASGPTSCIYSAGSATATQSFYIAGSETMTLNATGLGLGTTSPVAKLEVIGSSVVIRETKTASTSNNSRLLGGAFTGNAATMAYLAGTSGVNTLYLGGGTSLAEPASTINFNTGSAGTLNAGTAKLTINSAGKVIQNSGTAPSGSSIYFHCRNSNASSNSAIQIDYTGGGGGTIASNGSTGGLVFSSYSGVIGVETYTENARATSTGVSVLSNADPTSTITVNGSAAFKVPTNITGATSTAIVAASDFTLIFNTTVACSVTMPPPASFPGRILIIKCVVNQVITSASSNIVSMTGTLSNSILANAGAFCMLQSDGTNWVKVMGT